MPRLDDVALDFFLIPHRSYCDGAAQGGNLRGTIFGSTAQ
jgi:hypothetical protein